MFAIEIGISVICSTNRIDNLRNILENYSLQRYLLKELILIINLDLLSFEHLNRFIKPYNNVQIYSLGSNFTLGECLNLAVERAKYPIIAKFDDDDYYGPDYLNDSIQYLSLDEIGIVGKSCIYIYFTNEKVIGLKNLEKENSYVNRVSGSTILFRKEMFNEIRFKPLNLGEDIEFCKDCLKLGYKIYSSNRYHYVYIRNDKYKHTWQIPNDYILKQCNFLEEIEDYKEYIYKSVNKDEKTYL